MPRASAAPKRPQRALWLAAAATAALLVLGVAAATRRPAAHQPAPLPPPPVADTRRDTATVRELLPQAVLPLAEGGHPAPDRGDMLADAQVDALNEGRVDLPAADRQYLLDRLQRAEHDPVLHADQTAPPHGLDHLRIEQLG